MHASLSVKLPLLPSTSGCCGAPERDYESYASSHALLRWMCSETEMARRLANDDGHQPRQAFFQRSHVQVQEPFLYDYNVVGGLV